MYNDTIKLLNLEQFNLKIKSLTTTKVDNILYCYITLQKQDMNCSLCGSSNLVVKEYYTKKIVHSISTNNPCFIMYKARRFKCNNCSSTFYELNPFASSRAKTSIYTKFAVLEALKSHTATFISVAKRLNISVTSVINIFDAYVDAK
jgi:transposase-like protein